MTANEFEKEFQLLRDELYAATLSWHTYLTVHNEAHQDESLLSAMNQHPSFWLVTLRALQHNTILVLGRLFDNDPRARTIRAFVRACANHPEIFTQEALRARRIRNDAGVLKTDWFEGWIEKAFAPDAAHLKTLETQADECLAIWRSGCNDLRNKIVAHHERLSKQVLDEIYGKTKVGDVTTLIRRLYVIEHAIQELHTNGRPLEFALKVNPRVTEAEQAAKGTLARLKKGTFGLCS
ncbi:MAG: hypothetical protein ABIJ96_01110 [Elusimicrobiota bacterium]